MIAINENTDANMSIRECSVSRVGTTRGAYHVLVK
jgi:hypothetical protein